MTYKLVVRYSREHDGVLCGFDRCDCLFESYLTQQFHSTLDLCVMVTETI